MSNKRPPPILAKSLIGLIALELAPKVNYLFKGSIDCDSAESLKKQFFSYQISRLFIQLQGNKVLIDLGGCFYGSMQYICSNNHPSPSLG